jgi:hypothetical protein
MSIEPGGGTSRKREKDAGEDHSGTTSGGGKKHSDRSKIVMQHAEGDVMFGEDAKQCKQCEPPENRR